MPSRVLNSIQYLLPRHALTRLAYYVARIESTWFKNALIGIFVRWFGVDLDEVKGRVPEDFATFNDFFVRALEPTARVIDAAPESVVAPTDGTLSETGRLDANRLLQAKGRSYTLSELLPIDLDDTAVYENGSFTTIYLAPRDYHRVHAPRDATLVAAHYVPGDLFSVNSASASLVPGLFCRNERLNLHFTTAEGPLVVVMVGALNVGSMSTPWTGLVRARRRGVVEVLDIGAPAVAVSKGEEIGRFNFGSTVILVFPPGGCTWREGLLPGTRVRMGEAIGSIDGARA